MQNELGLIGDVSHEMRELPWSEVALCDNEQAAMRLCIRKDRARRTQEAVSEIMGYRHGTFSAILNSDRHRSRPRHSGRVFQIDLQRICGNRAIDQWARLYEQGGLVCQRSKEAEIAELEAELARLKSA